MEKKCKDLVRGAFNSRMRDIKRILSGKLKDESELPYNIGEYGLSIDYVEPNTFKDQKKGYWRYQLSWGGPSEEFRVYRGEPVEFWYLDWYDGAKVLLNEKDGQIIRELIDDSERPY